MNKLDYYREKIDSIDEDITQLLLLRIELVKKIGTYKKKNKIRVTDKKRESDITKNIEKYPNKHKKFLKEIFCVLLDYSKKIQK